MIMEGYFLFRLCSFKANKKIQFYFAAYYAQHADLKTNMAPIIFGTILKTLKYFSHQILK